ncbi:LysR family transcriptional regulator ArgP [Pseudooceanicola sp. CBS1P-1]|uniref:ArgP/LysG family DNA-binding transcriptional regulator n=1 Tax=Pseudooceanicola albus TaxID=2692189 RepID=A0A6L7GAQ2_9RHOB|nr:MULTISPECIES: LysR family transcriptional regulator ArgP [Pseudooceanicola]MBT9387002.1 LysR family transcriptional regulator ArgP [Pseudooceanicola endophyticus]MXN21131.1 ArgP/LysG family DNA-binding transcriptional regulator [Pseudooceanicola albus]
MIDYGAARAVAAVVRTGSFDQAAAALNVTPSAISQRVRQLEERMGTVLIRRGAPCTATEAGAQLCRHMEQVGMLEQDLVSRLPALAPEGTGPVTLCLACNADSLGTWFLPALAEFGRETGYLFDITVEDEDHTADWLRQGRVLAAVSATAQPVQGCRVIPLGALRYHATASPDYILRHFPEGLDAGALERAPALTFDRKDRLQKLWARQAFGREVRFASHWLASTHGFLEASLAGMGWALNPAPLAAAHLAAGTLVELLPGEVFDRPLYWQINRHAAAQLTGLTKAVTTRARAVLV